MKLGVGLYGRNGHQLQDHLVDHPRAKLVAMAKIDSEELPDCFRDSKDIRYYDTLDEILADDDVQVVSLCSPPLLLDQADDAIKAMRAGKHVYAEKPCAFTEEKIDELIAVSKETGMKFHEMAGTGFHQPYLAMRKVVQAGTIGEVVQVIAQKSYSYHDRRPQNEDCDGGLTRQVGVHALRFIEQVACQRITYIDAVETKLGNPVKDGGLNRACSMMMRLANGGVAVATVNYLNQNGTEGWAYEFLRIFGTKGIVESNNNGISTRLYVGEDDLGPLDVSEPSIDYFDLFVAELLDGAEMPMTLEEELHAIKMANRAKSLASKTGIK